jgi:TolA-binding protein
VLFGGVKRAIAMKEQGSDLHPEREETSQLRLGMSYEQEGKINDALATYLGVIVRYPGSEER